MLFNKTEIEDPVLKCGDSDTSSWMEWDRFNLSVVINGLTH